MPRKTKDAPGRVTPKGGPVKRAGISGDSRGAAAVSSGRYTAPIPREFRSSPWWVPALIVAFFVLGILTILLNYLGLLHYLDVTNGGASNVFLFVGLGFIVAGFVTSTRWH